MSNRTKCMVPHLSVPHFPHLNNMQWLTRSHHSKGRNSSRNCSNNCTEAVTTVSRKPVSLVDLKLSTLYARALIGTSFFTNIMIRSVSLSQVPQLSKDQKKNEQLIHHHKEYWIYQFHFQNFQAPTITIRK